MNITDTIKNAIGKMLRLNLGQERMSQFNKDPNSKYACFFTCCLMYFRTVYKVKLSFDEYKRECLRVGAIKNNFFILDHSKMAESLSDMRATLSGIVGYERGKEESAKRGRK